ncbi:MAG: cell division protein ZapA [Bacteroidales bacterium]|jgi:cell division protein ZapA|nr:cell division protein ZapA [Bacteroidales bacterium]
MDDKLSIRVNVADRYYPLKIEKDDEEKIRKAAKLINDKVLMYKQRYVDKDTQDFLAMAALQFVIQLIGEEQRESDDDLPQILEELNRKVESVLNKE